MNVAATEANLTATRNGSIGKYELLQELGSGATSTVYLARDKLQQHEVAVKVIHTNHLESEEAALFQHMFLTEARLVGKLRHPHVVAILDAAVDDKGCYIVMEFVDGSTLEEYCRPGQLPAFEVAVDIAYKCSKGLALAQRHGLIHRDIKPANILMARDGRIKITDFGAALSPKLAQITHISGLGSVAYMSPQQIRGDQPLTFHTDIYSLGIVLFKMLTGRTPYLAQNIEELTEQVVNKDVPAPSSLREEIPPQIDRIVQRATARDLDKRYRTWDEFAADLANAATLNASKVHLVSEKDRFSTLRGIPLLANFSDDEIQAILPGTLWRQFAAGARVLSEGDEGYSFFVLVEGKLKVMKSGREVGEIGSGDWFGEIAYLTRGRVRHTATVVSVTDVRAVEFNPDLVWVLLEGAERKIDAMLQERLARRFEEMNVNLARMRGEIQTEAYQHQGDAYRMMPEEATRTTGRYANAPDLVRDPIVNAIDNLDLSLLDTAKEIRESQQLLSTSFGDMTAHFAQVHSIAVAGEGQGTAPGGALSALRGVVDSLTVELQVEDSLNQLLGKALGRIESISKALTQTRSMVERACSAQEATKCNEDVLAAFGRNLESLRQAEQARGSHRFDTAPGSIDLF